MSSASLHLRGSKVQKKKPTQTPVPTLVLKKVVYASTHGQHRDVCEDWACIKLRAFLGMIVEWDFKKYSTPNKNVLGLGSKSVFL